MMRAAGTSRSSTAGPPRWVNRLVLALLRSPAHTLLGANLCELRYRTRGTGRLVALPVSYAEDGDRVVIEVAYAAHKRWWRTFRAPWPVTVRMHGRTTTGLGRVLNPTEPGYAQAAVAYGMKHARPQRPDTRVLVIEGGVVRRRLGIDHIPSDKAY
jgi:hypothetical protein